MSWTDCADAIYKIGEAAIAFAIHKTGGPGSCGPVVTGNNNEYYEMWEELNEVPWASFAIVTTANTPAEHDYQVKLKHIIEFLKKKDKVRVNLFFRGRQMEHRDIGRRVVDRFVQDCMQDGQVEKPPMMQGRVISVTISPK